MAAMKIDKKIRQMPWPDGWHGGQQDFIVTFSWPVVDHERLLVATFIRNRDKKHWRTDFGPDFRLICSKKEKKARIFFRGGRAVQKSTLRDAFRGFCTSADACYPEISKKDEDALGRWLGCKPQDSHNHLMPQLETWVEDAVEAETRSDKVARGEILDEEYALCPEELPEGLVDYIRNIVLPQDDVLIYKKGNVRGTCYLCREKVKAVSFGQRFRQSEYVTCPSCGSRVYALLEGSDRFRVDYVQDILTIQKGTDGETVFVRQWHLLRDQTARWRDIPAQLEEIARYAVRGNHAAKWKREAKENYFMNTTRYRLKSWERVRNVHAVYDGGGFIYIPDNWREIFAGTSLRYLDMEDYAEKARQSRHDRYTVRLMMDWARYPVVEKFWKAGYTGLVHEKLRGFWARHRYAINWNRPTIAGAIKFPKRLLNLYPPEEWTMDRMQTVADAWKLVKEGKARESDLPELLSTRVHYKEVLAAFGHASVSKILKYAGKHVVYTYRDYLNDCVKLSWNLDDPQVLFPKDLTAAHQRSLEQVKYEASKEADRKLQKTREKALWQEWEQGDLLIRWPLTGDEIIREGQALHHCVGGYVQRAADGVTTILFIRRKEDPGTPFFTLEWNGERVVQCKGTKNNDYRNVAEVEDFVSAWVNHIKRAKRNKKEKAA